MPRSPDQTDAYIGRRIARRRGALGLTQADLAARLGVSFQQVQKYEAGANRVSASRLSRIAGLLGASVLDFLPRDVGGAAPDTESDLEQLNSAFLRIGEDRVRRAVSQLVKALAE